MLKALSLLRHELRLGVRDVSTLLLTLGFFGVVVTLFPLAVGPDPALLSELASGVIWTTALLAALLSLDRLFYDDFRDGFLEQIIVSGVPLPMAVVVKAITHWLLSGLPLTVLGLPAAIMLNLPFDAVPTLLLALFLGTPVMSLIGAVGAALGLGARRGAALVPLIVLPLIIPAMIFGSGAVTAASAGDPVKQPLLLLAAIFVLALTFCPFAAAAALRQALD